MQTITVPKIEYEKILDNQRKLSAHVFDLRKRVSRTDSYEDREFLSSAIKRIEKVRKEIEDGKGIVLNSKKEIKIFFDNL